MHLALTDDQRAIRDSAADILTQTCGLEHLRTVIESPAGWDETLWQTFAREMGFAGMMVPDDYGGAGLGVLEMALVLEQTGRTLAAIPFFETAVLAAQSVLLAGSEEQKQHWLPKLASGEYKAAFAFSPAVDGRTARLSGDILNGASGFVTFAHVADVLIVIAQSDNGPQLVVLPADTHGINIQRQNSLDLTRPFSQVEFADVQVPDTARLVNGDNAIDEVLAMASGLLASEQTGGAAFCLSSTVEYVQQRVQFGRVIGSFQAIKHSLADMMVEIESARSAALYAATMLATGDAERFEAASVARSWCSDAFHHCAGEAIQLHGGIGYTWEHHAHLYFKRARSSASWFGSADEHREKIAGWMGLD